jgi:hypothetical protein
MKSELGDFRKRLGQNQDMLVVGQQAAAQALEDVIRWCSAGWCWRWGRYPR